MNTVSRVRQAGDFVLATARELRISNQTRLPTIDALCRLAGVSRSTMAKAVARLKAKGHIGAKPGRGIHINDSVGQQSTPVPPRSRRKWEMVLDSVRRDIAQGAFLPSGELPRVKALAIRYRVTDRTVRKAVDAVAADGLIVPHGRGFSISGFSRNRESISVLVVGASDPNGNLALRTEREGEFLRALRQECTSMHMGLHVLPIQISGEAAGHSAATGDMRTVIAEQEGSCVGVVLRLPGFSDALPDVTAALKGTKVPIAILVESAGEFNAGAIPWKGTPVKTFSIAESRQAGVLMGRYLLSKGHEKIAYISPHHYEKWPELRLAGLKEAYATAGLPKGVVSLTAMSSAASLQTDTYRTSLRMLSSLDLLGRFYSVRQDDDRILTGSFQRLRKRLTPSIDELMELSGFTKNLTPLMQQAVRLDGVTAWVAAHDDIAVGCIRFLQSRGKRVPHDISVVGFDDSNEAFSHHLTSFNFNTRAAIHAMLAYFMSTFTRSAVRPGPRVRHFAADGFVTERASVRNLRTRD